ncbi:TonB-dependent receptor [Solimicrobium silvestre]|uniref:TonB-dependent Receptor Plug Domain n=1 Tax=Solimicrobium silvestre TaxID=2099400 RepID=A0A2S9H1T4_9BURK|nr:TonB-dependent receptor [Solimicrobium silvestre]PRC93826.1 TonB-dependent Receptor Plug Domain [Solimicrobium silvestre]
MNQFDLKPCALNVIRALSVMCLTAPMLVHAQQTTDLGVVGANGTATNSPAPVTEASKAALSQGSLDARSAQSVVSADFIDNFMSPVSDFSQVFQLTPGAFSYSPNGVGQGNAATTIRGLTDSQYLVTFDGIPFNDTNGVSHHSYVYFPAMEIGGAVVDRSPGTAATIGQATFGGSLNLLSRNLETAPRTSITGSYGTWDTGLVVLEHETGQFGPEGASNLLINAQQMTSDGYQTYNHQNREAFSGKYQYIVSADTVVTLFASYMDVRNNQLDAGAPTRAQVAQFGDNYLNSNDPTQSNYYGYNFYNVKTSFQYIDVASNLGNGWKLDNKFYNYGYHNQENIGGAVPQSTAKVLATANVPGNDTGIDKLNSYHTTGNILRVSKDTDLGTFRSGVWLEYANSDRHQYNSNELDSWQDEVTPRFSETYQTTTLQPYAEFEFKVTNDLKITPGLKLADYEQNYDHLQDLKKVGLLGGTLNKTTGVTTGGMPDVTNSVNYHDVLPTLDVHYQLQPNWSTYFQAAQGDLIPPTSVFDVPYAKVATPPKAQKSTTYQIGTVYKADKFTVDADVYHTKLDNSYSCATDPTDITTQICVASGTETTQGLELEGTLLLGGGFSIYANGTVGTTKYSTGQWVAGAPSDVETLGFIYADGGWNSSIIAKRVGKLYNDGAAAGDDSYTINPVVLTNMFVNYTVKNPTSFAKAAKVQLAVNNLFDKHNITGISGSGSDSNPLAGDFITMLPARSVALTVTVDF